MKRLTLIEEIKSLTDRLVALQAIHQSVLVNSSLIQKRNDELEKDKRWLQTLIQELSSSINAGAREGNFPRK